MCWDEVRWGVMWGEVGVMWGEVGEVGVMRCGEVRGGGNVW